MELRPLAAERCHEHGFDKRLDVGLARVVRAELGTLGGVERALEERAHDARLDKLPVGLTRIGELAQFLPGELKDGEILEEVAVEMANPVFAERAAGGHDGEETFERDGEVVRVVEAALEQVGEKIFRQQAGVLGEKTKDEAVEEAADAEIFSLGKIHLGAGLRVGEFDGLALLERLGDGSDFLGEVFGDLRGREHGPQRGRVGEKRAQDAPVFRLVHPLEGELVFFLNGAVEVGANDEAHEIAGDEQWRVEQRLAVKQKLVAGLFEVLVLALVFPAEAILPPDIGEAFPRFRARFERLEIFDDALLKTEPIAPRGIGLGGCLLAEETAEVVEMLLIRGGFLAAVFGPLRFELGDGHRMLVRGS